MSNFVRKMLETGQETQRVSDSAKEIKSFHAYNEGSDSKLNVVYTDGSIKTIRVTANEAIKVNTDKSIAYVEKLLGEHKDTLKDDANFASLIKSLKDKGHEAKGDKTFGVSTYKDGKKTAYIKGQKAFTDDDDIRERAKKCGYAVESLSKLKDSIIFTEVTDSDDDEDDEKQVENPLKDMRTDVLGEFKDSEGETRVFHIDYDSKTHKLVAGGETNSGVIPEVSIDYDSDFSLDKNLQTLIDAVYSAGYTDIDGDYDEDITDDKKVTVKQLLKKKLKDASVSSKSLDSLVNKLNDIVSEGGKYHVTHTNLGYSLVFTRDGSSGETDGKYGNSIRRYSGQILYAYMRGLLRGLGDDSYIPDSKDPFISVSKVYNAGYDKLLADLNKLPGNRMPPTVVYLDLLDAIARVDGISKTEARDKYEEFTTKEWKDLLKSKHAAMTSSLGDDSKKEVEDSKETTEELIKRIKEAGTATEADMKLLQKRVNAGDKSINRELGAGDVKCDDDWAAKELTWLRSKDKDAKGDIRDNSPLGSRERDVLDGNNIKVWFDGFYTGRGGFNLPLYTVESDEGSFEYYVKSGVCKVVG